MWCCRLYTSKYRRDKRRLKDVGVEEDNIFITREQGTIWIKSDGSNIVIEKLQELNLDGANKMSYRSIFDICSYFFIKIS